MLSAVHREGSLLRVYLERCCSHSENCSFGHSDWVLLLVPYCSLLVPILYFLSVIQFALLDEEISLVKHSLLFQF